MGGRCVCKQFGLRIMGSRRSGDDRAEYGVKVRGETMAARVNIDGGIEGFDVNCPVMLRGQDGDILLAKMMAIFASMLQHCRLVLCKSQPLLESESFWSHCNLNIRSMLYLI